MFEVMMAIFLGMFVCAGMIGRCLGKQTFENGSPIAVGVWAAATAILFITFMEMLHGGYGR